MTKVRFNTQSYKGQSYIKLVYRYRIGSKQIKFVYSTRRQIPSEAWNPKSGQVRRYPGVAYDEINTALRNLATKAESILNKYQGEGRIHELTKTRFTYELDVFWNGQAVSEDRQLFGFFEQIIEERKQSKALKTWESYHCAFLRLKQYAEKKRMLLSFEDIDFDFLADWTAWLRADGLSQNTVYHYVSKLKTVMSEGLDRNLHQNQVFRSKRFTVEKEEVQSVYLTETEVAAISRVSLPDEKLVYCRDLFLISCYTGLRFSDVGKVGRDAVIKEDGVDLLKIEMQKRRGKKGSVVYIPLSDPIRSILESYEWSPPPVDSLPTMNIRIRKVCKLAGIKDPVPGKKKAGSLRVESTVPKWKSVSWHTARRSFATNEYLRAVREGQSIRPIMDIGGWSNESTFLKYVKTSRLVSTVEFMKKRAG